MTLGEHIQALRKEQSLSQEALGESLGVTRQSISKWESDGAIPELEKLITMSRLFGVTVGELLQVEHSQPEGDLPHELTERELAAVEAIVAKYLSESQRHTPPAPKRRWPILVGLLAVLVCVNLFTKVGRLDSRMDNLQSNIGQVNERVSNQIGSLTHQLEEILERQNSVTASESFAMTAMDLKAGTATYTLEATPKQYREGMTAQFTATLEDGVSTAVGAMDPDSHSFTATLTCPLTDFVTFSVSFGHEDAVQTRVLGTDSGRLSETRPSLMIHTPLFGEPVGEDGTFLWDTEPIFVQALDEAVSTASGTEMVAVRSMDISIYVNRNLVHTFPMDMSQVVREELPGGTRLDGMVPNVTLSLKEGDEILLMASVTDSLGRSWREIADCLTVEEGHFTPTNWPDYSLEFLASLEP